jgi:hypothetical protein
MLHWSFWQSHIVAHVIEALELQRLGREQVTLASGKTPLWESTRRRSDSEVQPILSRWSRPANRS